MVNAKFRIPAALSAALTATIVSVMLFAAPGAKAAWTVKGGGFGHGVGMSAYGAYGMAEHGWSYRKILRHYYQHTRIRELRKARTVRVLLNIDPGNVYFSGAERACGVDLTESRTYGAKLAGNRVRLIRQNGRKLADCGRRLRTENDGRVVFKGLGRYRGGVEVVPTGSSSGSLNAINAVSVNAYVKGVIPNESIPSWPMEALRTQAVASRSFALTGGVDGNGFDLYNDTRSQVYGPISTEYRRTNRAASQTSKQVVTFKKKVALTVFSASSGGHTENVENIWFGDPVPYLQGVRDPYDDVSPYHRWKVTFTNSDMNGRLAAYVKGRLKKVKITQYGVSKRVIWARLYGTGGMSKIRGDSLQYALGLNDRLVFSIKPGAKASAASRSLPEAEPAQILPAGIGTILPSTEPSSAPATTSEG